MSNPAKGSVNQDHLQETTMFDEGSRRSIGNRQLGFFLETDNNHKDVRPEHSLPNGKALQSPQFDMSAKRG
jgi:hypothetical protein